EARDAIAHFPQGGERDRFRALVALAAASADTKQVEQDDFTAALAQVRFGDGQPWEVLRLIEAGARAGVPADALEPAAAAAGPLAPWARLLVLRVRLAGSRSSLPGDVLDSFPPHSLAGRVARLD